MFPTEIWHMKYPKELVEKAKFELSVFERVSQETGKELVAEVERLRKLLEIPSQEFTHQCRACCERYTPRDGESEDCPYCGSNGVLPDAASLGS